VAAALQSARLGAATVLTEETTWLGGMYTAAGVSWFDGNPFLGHSQVLETGIYGEICQALRDYYLVRGTPMLPGRVCFAPSVADAILKVKCGAEPALTVHHGWRPIAVLGEGDRVLGVTFATPAGQQTVQAAVAIDCTETGDLLQMLGTDCRVGRETSVATGEPHALGGPQNSETGENPEVPPDTLAQAPTAVLILERRAGDNPSVPLPEGIDESLFYDFANPMVKTRTDGASYPLDLQYFLKYCRLVGGSPDPDSHDPRTWPEMLFINWPIYGNACAGVNYYLADATGRAEIMQRAYRQSLGFVHHFQEELRAMLGYNPLALSTELGPDGLPPLLYIRESARLQGCTLLTENHLARARRHCLHLPPDAPLIQQAQERASRGCHFSDGIALGDYSMDLFPCREWTWPYNPDYTLYCQRAATCGSPGGSTVPFQVPYRALVPATLDGLLVGEKNISATHIAAGATRLQPVVTLIGQAAGAAVALCAQGGLQPRQLSARDLQLALLVSGDALYYWSDIYPDHPQFLPIQQLSLAGVFATRWPNPIFPRKSLPGAYDVVADHSFRPDASVSRADLAVFLCRAMGLMPSPNPTPTYTDVYVTDWTYPYVEALAAAGVWEGLVRAGGAFSPTALVTRAQMAMVLCYSRHLLPLRPSDPTFIDVGPGNKYYGWVEAALAAGLCRGIPTSSYFLPDRIVTRAECARWLYNTWWPMPPANQPPELVYDGLADLRYRLAVPVGVTTRTRVPAIDPEDDPISYAAVGLPEGAAYDQQGWLTLTPDEGLRGQTIPITLSACDGLSTDYCDLNLLCIGASLVINDGAALTNSRHVNLTLQVDGAKTVRIANEQGVFSESRSYAQRIPWTLSEGDGPKEVSVRVNDDQGVLITLRQRIVLDTTPPEVTSLSPSDGSRVSGTVTVTAAARDDHPGNAWGTFGGHPLAVKSISPYTWVVDTNAWRISDGPVALEVSVSDAAGNSTYISRTLVLDNATFDDVPRWDSSWPYVEAIYREGITTGCSANPPLYCPNNPVTRGQMAVFLCRAAGIAPYDTPAATFGDVPKGSALYGYVEALVQAGVTSGCSANPPLFCPNASVTRGQMAVFLCRAAGIAPYNKATPTFGDVPKTNSQYAYIEALVQAGVTSGCSANPPLFCPNASVTRGQMAVFLCLPFGLPTGR